jgi:hypothetical protein
MRLIVNGCSHAAGAELEAPSQGWCYEKAWGQHLANKFNWDYTNLAMSGSSIRRIVRTSYEFLFDYIKKGNSTDELFFVVMWPGYFRTELFFDNPHEWNWDNGWVPLVIGNDKRYKKTFPSDLYNYYRRWVVLTSNKTLVTEYYNYMLNLQNLLYRYKIKYLFLSAVEHQLSTNDEYNPYKIHIDKTRYPHFLNQSLAYTNYCGANNRKISQFSIDSGYNSHYDEDTQKWYADYLFDLLHEKELL